MLSCPEVTQVSGHFFATQKAVLQLVFGYIAVLFIFAGSVLMTQWALKKHAKYKKEFGKEYPRGRKVMIPFIF